MNPMSQSLAAPKILILRLEGFLFKWMEGGLCQITRDANS